MEGKRLLGHQNKKIMPIKTTSFRARLEGIYAFQVLVEEPVLYSNLVHTRHVSYIADNIVSAPTSVARNAKGTERRVARNTSLFNVALILFHKPPTTKQTTKFPPASGDKCAKQYIYF